MGPAMYEQLYERTGILTILGSGLMWSWYDALFMSRLTPFASNGGETPELACALVFSLSLLPLLASLAAPRPVRAFLESAKGSGVVGAAGTAGSVAIIAASAGPGPAGPLMLAGCLLAGCYMGLTTVEWGAVYCQGGSITATPYVAGAFALAFVLDVPLFFMDAATAAAFFAAYPLLSALVFAAVPGQDRSYRTVLDDSAIQSAPLTGRRRGVLGVPLAIGFGYALVMVGFGFFQHIISFSTVASGGSASLGGMVQSVRGAVAIGMFALILARPQNSRYVYRVCLPFMIAGCMVVPLCVGSAAFPVAASLIIGGYTAFDLFIWVIFSSIACTQSRDPFRTIVLMRIIAGAFCTAGEASAMALVGFGSGLSSVASGAVAFAGYLVVIAVVLLLSSEEVFALTNGYFEYREAVEAGSAPDEEGEEGEPGSGRDVDAWMAARFAELGLTERESQVASLLAHGRTQRWISDYLCISQNTVGTHLRRIYQKAGVHSRQEFLDVLARRG